MNEILKKAEIKHILKREEIIFLLENSSIDNELFKTADRVREKYVGNEVHLRALIEFSNICKQHCKYCGLRTENKKIERYLLDEKTILNFAKKAVNYGYKTVVLQSGESDSYSTEQIINIIKKIKSLGLSLTLSIGEKTFEEYKEYKKAGADRYLLRIETTDKDLYKKLHPKMDFENRIQCLYNLKKLDYEVGTGCLVGLPGQTLSSLADDILFFKELDADMIGLGPFIHNPNTPLKNEKGGSFNLALKVMAITRLILPDINIPATTAMETLNSDGRIIALQSGANVVMPNATEGEYRKKYALYPGKICVDDTPAKCTTCINSKITNIGRTISQNYGISRHFIKRIK
ncbi:MAG: [FeFe] hydrogenase H-cluster radical SAM maturase HydE [Endomicrobiaceae bacterium]|nr:[FeFe] hydrogenase H-cluster radical SAM maturase HydE [Endomicrobiaceae bacterium]